MFTDVNWKVHLFFLFIAIVVWFTLLWAIRLIDQKPKRLSNAGKMLVAAAGSVLALLILYALLT